MIRFSLPLLFKELLELANRRRTYDMRLAWALLLFLISSPVLVPIFEGAGGDPTAMLGAGAEVMAFLVSIQLVGIAILLPASLCGSISAEREKGTLELLLVTDLGLGEIVVQKLASGLVPVLSLVLLSLPLMALAYSLGGVSQDELWSAGYILFLTAVQVGALSIACSARCRSPMRAFVNVYAVVFVFYFVVGLLALTLLLLFGIKGNASAIAADFWEAVTCTVAPSLLAFSSSFQDVLLASIPAWLSVFVCLALAVRFLRKYGTSAALREAERSQVSQARHRPWYGVAGAILLVIVAVYLMVGLFVATQEPRAAASAFSILMLIAWPVTAALLCAGAANAFASERTGQTLEVLLTTPLSAAELVTQKTAALRRTARRFRIGAGALCALVAFLRFVPWGSRLRPGEGPPAAVIYACSAALSLAILPSLAIWLGMWIGLRVKTRGRAMFAALATLFVWCAVPPLIFGALLATAASHDGPVVAFVTLMLSSPATMLVLQETGELRHFGDWAWIMVIINAGIHGVCLACLRSSCIVNADRLLGRIPDPDPQARGSPAWA